MPMWLVGKKMQDGYVARPFRRLSITPGYKYSKYKQALEFICAHGYIAVMKAAEHWKNAYGKYDAI